MEGDRRYQKSTNQPKIIKQKTTTTTNKKKANPQTNHKPKQITTK